MLSRSRFLPLLPDIISMQAMGNADLASLHAGFWSCSPRHLSRASPASFCLCPSSPLALFISLNFLFSAFTAVSALCSGLRNYGSERRGRRGEQRCGDRQNYSVCRRRLPFPPSLLPAPARKKQFDAAYRTARWRSAESLSLPPPPPPPPPFPPPGPARKNNMTNRTEIGRIIQSAAAASPSPLPSSRPPPAKNNLTLHIEPRGGDRQNHSVCRRRFPSPPFPPPGSAESFSLPPPPPPHPPLLAKS